MNDKSCISKQKLSFLKTNDNLCFLGGGSKEAISTTQVILKHRHAIRLRKETNLLSYSCDPCRHVFQISIQKILVFMHRVKTCSDVPSIFTNKFIYPSYRYPTNFSQNNVTLPKYLSHESKYKISIWGPSLRKKCFPSYSAPYFTAFGLNTERCDTEYIFLFSPNAGKYGPE